MVFTACSVELLSVTALWASGFWQPLRPSPSVEMPSSAQVVNLRIFYSSFLLCRLRIQQGRLNLNLLWNQLLLIKGISYILLFFGHVTRDGLYAKAHTGN